MLTQSMGDGLFNDPFYTMDPYHNILRLPVDFDLDHYNWDTVMCVVVESCPYVNGIKPHSERFWNNISQIQRAGCYNSRRHLHRRRKDSNFVGMKKLPVKPDIFTMGKAITGGYFPLSIAPYIMRKI